MALSSLIQWEVRTTGSDTQCGGGFKAGATGTDYSQQNTAQKSGADLAAHASDNTKVSPVAAKVAATDVGNVIQITAGTDWTPGFYEITAQDGGDPGYWTLDRSPSAAGNVNAGTYYMGGALASPGKASTAHVANNTIWVKSGTYSIAYNTERDSGVVSLKRVDENSTTTIEGYDSTRGDRSSTKPVLEISAGVSAATIITMPASSTWCINLKLDGNAQTTSRGVTLALYGSTCYLCDAVDCTNRGFYGPGTCIQCTSTGHSTQAAFESTGSGACLFCEAYSGTSNGFAGHKTYVCCISSGNAIGFNINTGGLFDIQVSHCISYGNSGRGFYCENVFGSFLVNCIAEENGGVGFYCNGSEATLVNCVGYNNTGGNGDTSSARASIGFIAVTAGSVFTNAAAGDFSLNNTASRGALLRATGYPATFPRGTTASYRDIGAAQHKEAAKTSGFAG